MIDNTSANNQYSRGDQKSYFENELRKYLNQKENMRWMREVSASTLTQENSGINDFWKLGWTSLLNYYHESEISLDEFIFFFECWGKHGAPHQMLDHSNLVQLILRDCPKNTEALPIVESLQSHGNYACVVLNEQKTNELRIRKENQQFVIDGVTPWILDVHHADFVLCFIRHDDQYLLFAVNINDSLLNKEIQKNVDASPALKIYFDNYQIDSSHMLVDGLAAQSLHDRVLGWRLVMESASLLGLSHSIFLMTNNYMNVRNQFGKTLFANQVIQHRLVNMIAQLKMANASLLALVRSLKDKNCIDEKLLRESYICKYQCSTTANFISKEALQLHGAIGYTEECDVGFFIKKIMKLCMSTLTPLQCLDAYSKNISS